MSDDVIDQTTTVAAAELRQFIERFERLEAEKKDIAERPGRGRSGVGYVQVRTGYVSRFPIVKDWALP